MAGSFTDYLEGAVLGHVFGATSLTPATHQAIALFATQPADDGTGGVEVSGGDYARVTVDNDTTTWNTPAGDSPTTVTNKIAFTFPTATGSWGTVAAFGIYDDSGTPNLLCSGSLTSPQSVPSGVTLSFPAGNLSLTLA